VPMRINEIRRFTSETLSLGVPWHKHPDSPPSNRRGGTGRAAHQVARPLFACEYDSASSRTSISPQFVHQPFWDTTTTAMRTFENQFAVRLLVNPGSRHMERLPVGVKQFWIKFHWFTFLRLMAPASCFGISSQICFQIRCPCSGANGYRHCAASRASSNHTHLILSGVRRIV
jgi:hypothetical protein